MKYDFIAGLPEGKQPPAGWKPTVFSVDMKNNITPHWTYWDRIEQEEIQATKMAGRPDVQLDLFVDISKINKSDFPEIPVY